VTIAQLPHEHVRFAHNSERQFAKLLDFYAIQWDYEPRTFVLQTDRAGNPQQAFTPDFYLPAYDLRHPLPQTFRKVLPVVWLPVYSRPHGVDDFRRACQAAHVGRENSFRATPHGFAFTFSFELTF